METKYEWIKTTRDDNSQIEFAVTSVWLKSALAEWAAEDAEDVENDKESYTAGRAAHLYDTFDDWCDDWKAQEIYEMAVRSNAIEDVK